MMTVIRILITKGGAKRHPNIYKSQGGRNEHPIVGGEASLRSVDGIFGALMGTWDPRRREKGDTGTRFKRVHRDTRT